MTDTLLKAHRWWWGLRPFGARSLVLVNLGFIFVWLGVFYLFAPFPESTAQSLRLLLNVADQRFWASVWIVAGCMGILSSRWPVRYEGWGFVALGGMSMFWAMSYLVGVLSGQAQAIGGLLVWIAFSVLLWSISRLQEPARMDPYMELDATERDG